MVRCEVDVAHRGQCREIQTSDDPAVRARDPQQTADDHHVLPITSQWQRHHGLLHKICIPAAHRPRSAGALAAGVQVAAVGHQARRSSSPNTDQLLRYLGQGLGNTLADASISARRVDRVQVAANNHSRLAIPAAIACSQHRLVHAGTHRHW